MLFQEPTMVRGWSIGQLRRKEYGPKLAKLLQEIEANDTNYSVRYTLVLQAVALASYLDYKVGVRVDTSEPEWPVFFIELPQGQVSWHLPQHEKTWDGHTTEEKYNRCREFKNSL